MKYGSYETIKSLAAQDGKAVFVAADKTSESYATKVYYLEFYAGKDPVKLEKFNESFYSRVEAQKKAALISPLVAPILQFGEDEKSAWYVTKLYVGSVDQVIAGRVTLDLESFYNILYSVVRGALDLKKASGRSHGNLRLTNILLSATKNIKIGQVVLTDPSAGDARQSDEIEVADLRAIGELMYRLIYPQEKRDIDLQKSPVLPTSQKWAGLFGGESETWFHIFNRLLSRKLTLKDYTLEQLEAELLKLKPKAARAPVSKGLIVGIVLAVAMLGMAAFLITGQKKKPAPLPAAKPSGAALEKPLANEQPADKTKTAVAPPQTPQPQSSTNDTPASPPPKPRYEFVTKEDLRKKEETKLAEEAKQAEAARQATLAKQAAEATRLAEQKNAAEAKAREEAQRKAEAEAKARAEIVRTEEIKRLTEEKRAAEQKAAAATKAREETQRKLDEAARLEAARQAAEQERLLLEKNAKLAEEARKNAELTAELERRDRERQEAAHKALETKRLAEEAKARELKAELARREKEKEDAIRQAAEAEHLRREAESKRLEQERKNRELAARLEAERQEKEAQARQLAVLRNNPSSNPAAAVSNEPTLAHNLNPLKPRPDKRWVNSLGMKFQPVGKILVCLWETRRKDYEDFIKSARIDIDNKWKSPSFPQTASHPVVNVSLQEAVTFCKWLTETERKKGLLSDTQFYRLPTEAEWSAANANPRDGSSAFFWGNSWPPPAGVGNFALVYSYDRFDYTAPVAQFRANAAGLYDLAGNVWEMCENGRDQLVACGGSWLTASADQLSPSFHLRLSLNERREDVGFRCVLVVGD